MANREWIPYEVNDVALRMFAKLGISVDEGTRWLEAGFGSLSLETLIGCGLTLPVAIRGRSLGLASAHYRTAVKLDLDPTDLVDLVETVLDPTRGSFDDLFRAVIRNRRGEELRVPEILISVGIEAGSSSGLARVLDHQKRINRQQERVEARRQAKEHKALLAAVVGRGFTVWVDGVGGQVSMKDSVWRYRQGVDPVDDGWVPAPSALQAFSGVLGRDDLPEGVLVDTVGMSPTDLVVALNESEPPSWFLPRILQPIVRGTRLLSVFDSEQRCWLIPRNPLRSCRRIDGDRLVAYGDIYVCYPGPVVLGRCSLEEARTRSETLIPSPGTGSRVGSETIEISPSDNGVAARGHKGELLADERSLIRCIVTLLRLVTEPQIRIPEDLRHSVSDVAREALGLAAAVEPTGNLSDLENPVLTINGHDFGLVRFDDGSSRVIEITPGTSVDDLDLIAELVEFDELGTSARSARRLPTGEVVLVEKLKENSGSVLGLSAELSNVDAVVQWMHRLQSDALVDYAELARRVATLRRSVTIPASEVDEDQPDTVALSMTLELTDAELEELRSRLGIYDDDH